jgi:arylsulfatase A-like enzyme/Tfp pilus assembly protein PilF
LLTAFGGLIGCGSPNETAAPKPLHPPSLLLVTLDTTRADSIEPESNRVATPHLRALAERGQRFSRAYSTAPQTLPAHASMFTGLYPAGHGVHENARRLGADPPLLAERLRGLGYATAAFVSGYPLERQFGLARGFATYDDEFGPGKNERSAVATTDRALAYLDAHAGAGGGGARKPVFLWIHYYDPHDPYAPPEPFRSRYAREPYLGEIAVMDESVGHLVAAFERHAGSGERYLLVVGDHGEGLGDHGEMLHGNLVYDSTMRVPLLIAGTGIAPALRTDVVSTRQVFSTLLRWAGGESGEARETALPSLLDSARSPALGEAMQPYLHYGWQPQVMAVGEAQKLIRSGDLEVYDVLNDPGERENLAKTGSVDRTLARAVAEYPLPSTSGSTGSTGSGPARALDEETARRLASLGYIASAASPVVRPDAPRPRDMTHLFADLDAGSRFFGGGRYEEAIAAFGRVLTKDRGNPMVAVHLAVANSQLGRDARALEAFRLATRLAPESLDIQHYLAMHHLRAGRPREAEPLFEAVLASQPEKLAALDGLAAIRESEGRIPEAAILLERAARVAQDPSPRLARLGQLRMAQGDTMGAIEAFERSRAAAASADSSARAGAFQNDLELGVLYLASRRYAEAAVALDRVTADHPGYPMALFKRAQVSVLLAESDAARRLRLAIENSTPETRHLIERERLFAGMR